MFGEHSKQSPAESEVTRCEQSVRLRVNDAPKNVKTPMETFFPEGHIYEHFLQRLRLVASQQVPVLRVHDIRDVPDSVDELPCIEVVIRIPGLKIYNPANRGQMISTDWLKKNFDGPASQKALLDAFADYLAASIPADHPEAHLKPKFKHYRDGAPGDLPTAADLSVWRDELVQHLVAAKKWLRRLHRPNQEFTKEDRSVFLKEISRHMFWWAKYVRDGQITLSQIARQSPKSVAMEILALKYGKKSDEAIKSRLYPSRRNV